MPSRRSVQTHPGYRGLDSILWFEWGGKSNNEIAPLGTGKVCQIKPFQRVEKEKALAHANCIKVMQKTQTI